MRVLKRIGVFSLAKLLGMSMAAMSFVFALFYAAIILIMSLFGMAGALGAGGDNALLGGGASLGMGVVIALAVVILVPIFYGVVGFLFGLLYGLIINVALGMSGGLEFETAEVA
jgi:hypothetical protein